MKNVLLLLLLGLLLLVAGCAGMDLISMIPEAEFTRFQYDRGGNVTSAHIEATNSKITGDEIQIDEISIKSDYGPAVNFNIKLEGYRRKLSGDGT